MTQGIGDSDWRLILHPPSSGAYSGLLSLRVQQYHTMVSNRKLKPKSTAGILGL